MKPGGIWREYIHLIVFVPFPFVLYGLHPFYSLPISQLFASTHRVVFSPFKNGGILVAYLFFIQNGVGRIG